jgi:hypothetical protein
MESYQFDSKASGEEVSYPEIDVNAIRVEATSGGLKRTETNNAVTRTIPVPLPSGLSAKK